MARGGWWWIGIAAWVGCASEDPGDPRRDDSDPAVDRDTDVAPTLGGLPPAVERAPVGEPLTQAEVEAFTNALLGFYGGAGWFDWIVATSHGLDASHDPTMPVWMVWWQDTQQVKAGDTITFRHTGGADNLMIRTAKILGAVSAASERASDPRWSRLVVGYSRGTAALFQGMVWGEAPAEPWPITARAIFPDSHDYALPDGRKVSVDYSPVKHEKLDWNAHTVPNDDNPYFGPDLWVRNIRSKDDLPHMWRMVPRLMRLEASTTDPAVKEAVGLALSHLRAMGRDIVDHGWQIRTVEDGEVFVPSGDIARLDLYASDVNREPECTARYTAAWLADAPDAIDGADCAGGYNKAFEAILRNNYFNLAIQRYFHLAALQAAVLWDDVETAERLMDGLVVRVDDMMAEVGASDRAEWDADVAGFLVAAAGTGLPLTNAEKRLIVAQYTASSAHYTAWPNWDPWADTVADGVLEDKPSRSGGGVEHVRLPEMVFVLEACAAPWGRTLDFVDCGRVLDPASWPTPPADSDAG